MLRPASAHTYAKAQQPNLVLNIQMLSGAETLFFVVFIGR